MIRPQLNIRLLVVAALLLLSAPAGYVLDRWLTRDDRIRFDEEEERLLHVRDAIVRFQLDHKRLPQNLEEMVPDHLAPSQLTFQVTPKRRAPISWAPAQGILQWAEPLVITGLFKRYRPMSVTVEEREIRPDPLTGRNVSVQQAEQAALPADTVVIEAERFHSLTYGWEIGEARDASDGCYLHIKEGVADFESEGAIARDPSIRSGDFYNIGRDRRRAEVEYKFVAPQTGLYFIYARTMAHRSGCSNIAGMMLRGKHTWVGRNGTTPFVWLWHAVGTEDYTNGVNSLRLMVMQDDVKVDQILVSPRKPSLTENDPRIFAGGAAQTPPPAAVDALVISLSASGLLITEKHDPKVHLYIHKTTPGERTLQLDTALDLPDGHSRERSDQILLGATQSLVRFDIPINLPRPTERREYLLRCSLYDGHELAAQRTLVLIRGYDWSVLAPLPYMAPAEQHAPETDPVPRPQYSFGSKSYQWQRYNEKHSNAFGILDFGRMISGRTFDALMNAALYAYTEVESAEAGTYRLKAMGDDNVLVWVNGRKVATIAAKGPPIRTAREIPIELLKGRNRILLRVNQRRDQWQAGIRIRGPNNCVADVVGIPFNEQQLGRTTTKADN